MDKNLTIQHKEGITNEMLSYIQRHSMSNNDFAKKSGVNPAFVSLMISKKKEVKDAWYLKVANYVGYSMKREYWPLRKTDEFIEVFNAIADAREMQVNKTVIGETGCGKTTAAAKYQASFPLHTYIITITDDHTKRVMYQDLCELMNLSTAGTAIKMRKRIVNSMKKMRLNGNDPVLIIDEAENMTEKMLQSLKAFYDSLEGQCPIVLLGTSQFLQMLESLSRKNKQGIPQFYSRFKAGIIRLDPIDRSFSQFLENIKDNKLIDLLRKTCNDYRELHDRLVYALKSLDRTGENLNYETYSLIHNIK
ncbi:MAG: ATP-binding protein [Marinifilaceae bacterium]|jgi:DNA transposition AAA+ family ATPase|nr:ATP-binding protein [Marinifilaceae bacterium]